MLLGILLLGIFILFRKIKNQGFIVYPLQY
ncbi:MAG: hypothetical protein RL344_1103 [Pseudomonadota bacterium]|jgi:hypothetical protein